MVLFQRSYFSGALVMFPYSSLHPNNFQTSFLAVTKFLLLSTFLYDGIEKWIRAEILSGAFFTLIVLNSYENKTPSLDHRDALKIPKNGLKWAYQELTLQKLLKNAFFAY